MRVWLLIFSLICAGSAALADVVHLADGTTLQGDVKRSGEGWAVTADDGTYTINGLPPGTYTVRVWHETGLQTEQQVTVSAGKATETNFNVKTE